MLLADRWEVATDFTDDTWVFQVGEQRGDGRAALVVAFSPDGDDTLARIYDGSVTGGTVSYVVEGNRVRVAAPQYPSMVIRALGGTWLQPSGALNYNLTWRYDGPAASRELAQRYPAAFNLDAHPDADGEVRDGDRDGVPEHLWYALQAPIPPTERVPRTFAQVNTGRHRPAVPAGVIFWPLLSAPRDPEGGNYFDTPLFLGVDWGAGLITTFRFPGYPIEAGYHINSLSPLQRGRVNVLSFENPMAYFDLAGDHDGRPELFIRMAYAPPGEPDFVSGGPTRSPIEMVQFSWNQRNHEELRWDYKVDLAGRNPIGRTVALGEFTVEQVPQEELPRWAVEHPWSFGTFVAFEGGESYGYLSSEGIYEWSTLEGVLYYQGASAGEILQGLEAYTTHDIRSIPESEQVQRDYVAGADSKSPEDLYNIIRAGFRGEYSDINGLVAIYFSPVDARLHLSGATRGVYNAGNGRRVEYRNMDRDGHIDSWVLYSGKQQLAQLLQSRDYLLYGEADRVTLLRARVPRESFRAQPPADHDEWLRLGAQLEAHRRDFKPTDLGIMVDQFDGIRVDIDNAALSAYRPVGESGFRFVLDLGPGLRLAGPDVLGLVGRAPGRYVVTYDGAFTVEPLTPPALSVALGEANLTEHQRGALRLSVWNDGLQDVSNATLEVWAAPAGGRPSLVGKQTVSLPGGGSTAATVEWAPPRGGWWTIAPQLLLESGGRVGFAPRELELMVQPAPAPTPRVVASISASPRTLPLAVLGLEWLAMLTGYTLWSLWGTSAGGRRGRG